MIWAHCSRGAQIGKGGKIYCYNPLRGAGDAEGRVDFILSWFWTKRGVGLP